MPLDPRRYDVNELRHAAHGRTEAEFDWIDGPIDEEWHEVASKRLAAAAAHVAPDGRPYLETIPHTPRAEQTLLDWCGYLVEALGSKGALDVLSYYRRIEWLGDDACETARSRILSLAPNTEPTAGDGDEGGPTEEHHIRSLSYVLRLASLHDD
ncbi:fla cluster protein flaD [Haloferax mucosum ATCC BAA-1512]|uniref:Fla cluster protein flaD n=1 Tax=Haloferax mucosum ATCC BAA-1512 TaxID=662479 RepID=M0IQ06_9EURY|nr:FlaD/FlaE family flagellar protein [Haloferax mucosum]ELZ98112.1 fla cluster protein flaD [Haloferax mucosum ATCC BAA-1512]